MPPIPKDPAHGAGSNAPASPASKPSEPVARPQPVALEIAVTINGVRTIEGSSKREPFSESTQTVLVFGNGAVIRLASSLAAGQLVFLTNEKTKKEVVCQVVKSKNYRTVTGYVELEFTEPAPGFWGMRFPAERVVTPVTSASGSARPVAPLPASTSRATPAAPPVPATAPLPAPVPAPTKPAAALPQAPQPVPVVGAISPTPLNGASRVTEAPVEPAAISDQPIPIAPSTPVIKEAEFESTLAPEVPKEIADVFFRKASTTEPFPKSTEGSAEEFKQRGSELEERLRASLFTPFALKDAPVSAETPPAESQSSAASVTPSPAISQFPPIDAEEIEIPAWLVPLARNSEKASPTEGSATGEQAAASAESAEPLAAAREEKLEPVEFRGQLLRDSSPPSPSRKGLFIGLAAAALLVIAAVAWYMQQPGNALSGLFGKKPAASRPAPQKSEAQPKPEGPVGNTVEQSVLPAALPFVEPNASESATGHPSASLGATTSSANDPAAATPLVPPKKTTLGKVHLAAPVVGRKIPTNQNGDVAPTIQDSSLPSGGDALSALATGSSNAPAAPSPIGGEVKQARLVKSVPPVYPQLARVQHISGSVQIDALIDASGNVTTMKILSGPVALHQAALQAVKQWKYEPAQLNGNPTAMHLTVTVQFRMD